MAATLVARLHKLCDSLGLVAKRNKRAINDKSLRHRPRDYVIFVLSAKVLGLTEVFVPKGIDLQQYLCWLSGAVTKLTEESTLTMSLQNNHHSLAPQQRQAHGFAETASGLHPAQHHFFFSQQPAYYYWWL